jgi:hypothetical protein
MSSLVGRMSRLLSGGSGPAPSVLDGFVDSLLQKFENCRAGLTDESLRLGSPAVVAPFFLRLYEEEVPRLEDTLRREEPHLSRAAREELFRKVDDLVRSVVLPGYVRVVQRYTRRERNDFYALPEPLHLVERILWSVSGMVLGAFVVWAPFIPMTAKEWVFPFAVGGLLFPELRRFLSVRRYELELNQLVGRSDREIARIDLAYLTERESLSEREEAEARADAAIQPSVPLPELQPAQGAREVQAVQVLRALQENREKGG